MRIAKYAGELRNYSAYVDWDAIPRLKEMKPPTLVVFGTEDNVFPQQGSLAMTQLFPNVEYKAFEGAGHGVTDMFPEAIDLILDAQGKRETLLAPYVGSPGETEPED